MMESKAAIGLPLASTFAHMCAQVFLRGGEIAEKIFRKFR